MDKSSVRRICIDDFAIRKRYTYGSVIVNIDTHRIIDIIDSRETEKVSEWLKTYPNLEVISRDGAQTYASAAQKAHPDAVQISDRFHLFKNLSDAAKEYIYRAFPSRVVLPSGGASPQMQALYDTSNRRERILFARKKQEEGHTVSDLALLLHASETTVKKYLSMSEEDIPSPRENVRERQHREAMEKKQRAVDKVRELYSEGKSIGEIVSLTGHERRTIKKYLKEDCPIVDGGYDCRMAGKLSPYEQEVLQMRADGVSYPKIQEHLKTKGYTGTEDAIRMFMQKERSHAKRAASNSQKEGKERVSRKSVCQLLYQELEAVKGMTQEQYEEMLKEYPVLGKIYALVKEFHSIVFSHCEDSLETWMCKTTELGLEELNRYINGLKADLAAVKNAIRYKYNNGLAEGSVNKIKLAKRIMYGRNSFALLKAKILLNEHYYQIN